MKSKYLLAGVFILTAVYVMRCTTALAPKQEGGAATQAGGETTGGDTGGETTGGETTGGETTGGETAGVDDTTEPVDEGTPLGTITDEETDIADFEGKSVYMLYLETAGFKSVSINVTTAELKDTAFKKIVSSECKACEGDDDPHCVASSETPVTPKTLAVTFVQPAQSTKIEADTGFPNADDLEKADRDDVESGFNLSFPDGDVSATTYSGTLKFATGKRPAAVGDAFEVDVDLSGDGKSYKAKLVGVVVEQHVADAAPTCKTGEYVSYTYED